MRLISASRVGPALAAASLLTAGGLCLALAPATAPSAAGERSGLSAEQLDFARKPIDYFNAKCANCHGEYGGYWGEGFVSAKTPAALREAVEGMCNGPAQAPLEGRALESQVGYNASLRDKTPFATAYAGEGGTLCGEVTPGAIVTLVAADGTTTPAQVDGHAWTSDATSAATVRAAADGKSVEIELKDAAAVAFPTAKPATAPATAAATRP